MEAGNSPANTRCALRGFSLRTAAVLAFLGFALGLGIAFLILREPTEPLSRDRLNSARARWNSSHIGDYALTVRMRGDEFQVTVRGGVVERITSGGADTQSNDPGAYSVDGIFRVLEQELDAAERLSSPPMMRARFDQSLGYPERYLRGAGEMGVAASIEILQLQPVGPS